MTEKDLLEVFRTKSLPQHYGIHLEFLPSDSFIRELTTEFGVEFASTFTCGNKCYFLYPGTSNAIKIPLGDENNYQILIKHSHPSGSNLPSIHDINWLKFAQSIGSPQKKSIILPIGKNRVYFRTNSKYLK